MKQVKTLPGWFKNGSDQGLAVSVSVMLEGWDEAGAPGIGPTFRKCAPKCAARYDRMPAHVIGR